MKDGTDIQNKGKKERKKIHNLEAFKELKKDKKIKHINYLDSKKAEINEGKFGEIFKSRFEGKSF